jgi:hypothetical protein
MFFFLFFVGSIILASPPLHASAPEVRQRLAQPVRAGNAPPILHSAGGAADYLKTKREQLRECHGLPIDRTPQ